MDTTVLWRGEESDYRCMSKSLLCIDSDFYKNCWIVFTGKDCWTEVLRTGSPDDVTGYSV